mmetsp:Transcript_65958/g.105839  ORF Transcript_65958/g.105839 Transcript_65958/m.105839 type:complete len:93 (+) Transcript_65958:480-758(+)
MTLVGSFFRVFCDKPLIFVRPLHCTVIFIPGPLALLKPGGTNFGLQGDGAGCIFFFQRWCWLVAHLSTLAFVYILYIPFSAIFPKEAIMAFT